MNEGQVETAYTLVIIRVAAQDEKSLESMIPPTGVVDHTDPKFRADWYRARFPTPEAVPLPEEGKLITPYEFQSSYIKLCYRVARIRAVPTILDAFSAEDKVRLRIGGKGSRNFAECSVGEANATMCSLLTGMVRYWANSVYEWDPAWEYLAQSVLWVKSQEATFDWASFGDSDESGGTSFDPVTVELPDLIVPEFVPDYNHRSTHIDRLRQQVAFYQKQAAFLEGFQNFVQGLLEREPK